METERQIRTMMQNGFYLLQKLLWENPKNVCSLNFVVETGTAHEVMQNSKNCYRKTNIFLCFCLMLKYSQMKRKSTSGDAEFKEWFVCLCMCVMIVCVCVYARAR
jgi:hypothetical protein